MTNIVIESMAGEYNIMLNRRLAREENRKADMEMFAELIKNPMNSFHRPVKIKKSKNGKTREVVDTSYREIWARGDKLTAQIVRLYQDYPGYEGAEAAECVTLEMISKLAKIVVEGPIELQLQLCREPNRQTSDERVQYEIRKKYLEPLGWKVENLPPGHLTLRNGDWVYDDASSVAEDELTRARSIDFRITNGKITIMDFAKFALVAGGGQGHQIKESKYFLGEVRKYIDKHPKEKVYFIDTLDGGYAEKFIESHIELLKVAQPDGKVKDYTSRVFVGNTESAIKWVMSLTK